MMSVEPPAGFAIGHWTDAAAATGCTAVIPPRGARCGVDIRGGGPGTRETDVISPLAGSHEVSAVMLAGGSAFGLGAADGAVRWLEERGRGHPTPGGVVPIVPAAMIYDLAEGDPSVRPGPEQGYAACEAARAGHPRAGQGRGRGRSGGRQDPRPRALDALRGRLCGRPHGRGETVAALAVVNAFGDVIGEGGEVLAGPRAGGVSRSAEHCRRCPGRRTGRGGGAKHDSRLRAHRCALDQAACARMARMASGGVARAVDPVFSDVDGDVVFCLASGEPGEGTGSLGLGRDTAAAVATAAAIRDASDTRLPAPTLEARPCPAATRQRRWSCEAFATARRIASSTSTAPPGEAGGDRQGVAEAAVAVRRAPRALLPAGPRPLRGPGGPGDGDLGLHRRRAPRLRSARPALSAPPRAPATRSCGCLTRPTRTRRVTTSVRYLACSTAGVGRGRRCGAMGPAGRRRRSRSG